MVSFHTSFQGWCQDMFFVPHAKTSFQFDFTPVRCRRSASYCSVVKDHQFFSNRHFVRCAVRSAARQHNVGCIVATHSICYVFKGVYISSVAVCFKVLCCTQARQPSIYHRCACVLHLAPAQKTDSSIDDSRNTPMLLPRTRFDRDSSEKDSRQDKSFIEME